MIMIQQTDFKNMENLRNDQPLKMAEELKSQNDNPSFNKDTSFLSYLSLETLKSGFNPVRI